MTGRYIQRDKTGTQAILWVIALIAVNFIVYFCTIGTNIVFRVSAFYPIYLCFLLINGLINQAGVSDTGESEFAAITVVILGIIILLYILTYILCRVFGRKHFGWRIAALVFFLLDTLFVIYILMLGELSLLLDLAFHALILYEMIAGIIAHGKLKTLMTADETMTEEPTE